MAKSTKMRVDIPTNIADLLNLATKVYAKHQEKGVASPLNAMEDNSWTTDGPKVTLALDFHNTAERLKKEMETSYKERDLLAADVKRTLLASRDTLTGIYRENMKQMGQWGFDVGDSVKATAATKAKKAGL